MKIYDESRFNGITHWWILYTSLATLYLETSPWQGPYWYKRALKRTIRHTKEQNWPKEVKNSRKESLGITLRRSLKPWGNKFLSKLDKLSTTFHSRLRSWITNKIKNNLKAHAHILAHLKMFGNHRPSRGLQSTDTQIWTEKEFEKTTCGAWYQYSFTQLEVCHTAHVYTQACTWHARMYVHICVYVCIDTGIGIDAWLYGDSSKVGLTVKSICWHRKISLVV